MKPRKANAVTIMVWVLLAVVVLAFAFVCGWLKREYDIGVVQEGMRRANEQGTWSK